MKLAFDRAYRALLLLALLTAWVPSKASAAATPSPTPSATPSEADQAVSEMEEDIKEIEEASPPFVPHWTGQAGFTYTEQISQGVVGQVQKELSLMGTYNMSKEGDYFSTEVIGGQQNVEGTPSNYGQLNLEGGLGWGIFLPSLELELQRGASALESDSAQLTLNFKVFDPLEIGPLVTAGLEDHQGAVSTITGKSDEIKQIDTGDIAPGIVVTFIPSDNLTLSLTAQQEYDDTYNVRSIVTLVTVPNFTPQRDRIPSLTLGENILFSKDLELDLTEQAGEEYLPAGTVYSPVLGKTVTNSTPTTQDFFGFSAGFMYDFE